MKPYKNVPRKPAMMGGMQGTNTQMAMKAAAEQSAPMMMANGGSAMAGKKTKGKTKMMGGGKTTKGRAMMAKGGKMPMVKKKEKFQKMYLPQLKKLLQGHKK